MNKYVQKVLGELKAKQPWEKEFLQAAGEVLSSLTAVLDADPVYEQNKILERMVVPERVILFQVPWGIMLPEGVFFVPPQGDFSTMGKVQNGL